VDWRSFEIARTSAINDQGSDTRLFGSLAVAVSASTSIISGQRA
jgi:hypothetical protein